MADDTERDEGTGAEEEPATEEAPTTEPEAAAAEPAPEPAPEPAAEPAPAPEPVAAGGGEAAVAKKTAAGCLVGMTLALLLIGLLIPVVAQLI